MQDQGRRSNNDRSQAMRAGLIDMARGLFARQGFVATGTPEIVAAAGVTRGALYHHFADKEALFAAVLAAEAEAVATAIRAQDFGGLTAEQALIRGGVAYLDAMQVPGRVRILLIDGPAVLGPGQIAAIDAGTGGGTLAEGLVEAGLSPDQARPMAQLLSAAFDRAALAVAAGEDAWPWQAALARIIRGVVADRV